MSSQRTEPLELLKRAGRTLTTSEARKAGVHWRDLYALRDRGELLELSRGVFRLTDADPTAYLDLIAVGKRVPRGTVCLLTALWFWDLTDEIPSAIDIAVPRGSWRPRIQYPPTRVHVFDRHTFDVGRQSMEIEPGEQLHVYSPERTVVDAMRLRHRLGSEIALEGLRRYVGRRGAEPGRLLVYARQLRAERPVAHALEVLLA